MTSAIAPRGQQRGDAARLARVVRPRPARADDVRRHSSAARVDDSARRPVMSLRSRVVAVKGVRVGEIVGYGARWTVPKPGRIAVVPAGYADGLDRRMAGSCSVLIRGKRAPIVGAVNMDMITVDVSDVKVETGDEVVIIGAQGDDRIDVREIAAAIGTNPYEVLCRVGTRIERIY